MNKNSTNPESIPAYSVYYRKRLQTHPKLALETPSELENIMSLIESQIKPHSHQHNLKERQYHRTLRRLRAIKDEQLSDRESLRSTIQEKMNTSMRSLEKQKIKREQAKTKKEEERKRKLEKIRSMERTLFLDSFSQSQMNSKESEKYLLQRQGRRIGGGLGQICTPVVSWSTDSQLSKEHSSHSRILPSVFKVTASDLMKKKAVKVGLETDTYNRHLLQHIQTLTKVSLNRSKRAEFINKSKDKCKQKQRQPKQESEIMPKCKMRLQSHVKSVQQNKESFSQSYSRCLKETQSRKFKIEVDFRERYQNSMNRGLERNKQYEIKKIVKESLNEIDRRCNYKLMQKSKGMLMT